MKKIFFVLAAILMAMNMWAEDFNTTLEKAQQGDARAQAYLSWMYMTGSGVTQNYALALSWAQKAADQGNPQGQTILGYAYFDGKGVNRDFSKAVYWYQKAAEQGYAIAQYNLAARYDFGEGVTMDKSKAVYWYHKAADQGDDEAQCSLGIMYCNGSGVDRDYKKAFYWLQKAAKKGNGTAQFNLGHLYEDGLGVKKDYSLAMMWYKKASYYTYAKEHYNALAAKGYKAAIPDFINVSIAAAERETEIWINGKYCGSGYCRYKFRDDTYYTIEGRRKGFQPLTVDRHDFNANSPKFLTIPELKGLYGKLNIAFLPKDATLIIDGITRPTENGEFSDPHIPIGLHVIQLRHEDYRSKEETVIVEIDELTAKSYELCKNPQSKNPIPAQPITSQLKPIPTTPQPNPAPIAKTSLIDTNIPTSKTINENMFVIIIANEEYKNVAKVPYALNDGRIFAKYCQQTLGVPAKQIKLYENATYNDMRLAVAWLKNVCEKFEGEASVIFYYTGHGIPDESDKSAYLLPVDGDGRYVATGYKMDDLYDKLGAMPAKSITVLLDACFSGASRDGKMLSQAKGIAIKAKKGIPQGNTVVLSAAQGDETAGFKEGEGHGMFTYYLLKKLQETKGDVTLQELSQYIIREVGRASVVDSKVQTPCVTPSASLGSEWQNWKLK